MSQVDLEMMLNEGLSKYSKDDLESIVGWIEIHLKNKYKELERWELLIKQREVHVRLREELIEQRIQQLEKN